VALAHAASNPDGNMTEALVSVPTPMVLNGTMLNQANACSLTDFIDEFVLYTLDQYFTP